MAKRKWKGKLTKDLLTIGDSDAGKEYTFKKGQQVIVRKEKVYEDNEWYGEYEYHYSDEHDKGLCRIMDLVIE